MDKHEWIAWLFYDHGEPCVIMEGWSAVLGEVVYIRAAPKCGKPPIDCKTIEQGRLYAKSDLAETPNIIEEPELPDPWPLLPERTDKQSRDDKIAVNQLLVSLNRDTSIDILRGTTKAKLFMYSEVEPIRIIKKPVDRKGN
jgi:hypothetical protein